LHHSFDFTRIACQQLRPCASAQWKNTQVNLGNLAGFTVYSGVTLILVSTWPAESVFKQRNNWEGLP
jgi:hypothetical protein